MKNLQELSLRQKLGQMLVSGFPALEMSPAFMDTVHEYALGNVILFKYNQHSRAQLTTLCQSLTDFIKAQTGIPPFISSDEEGGLVSRLPADMAKMPSALGQAMLNNPARVQRAAALCARQLQGVGINFNLAPVLDINNNPLNPVIGVRSYGGNAATVSRYALAAYHGYAEAGLLCTGKHFPGHGDTEADSHLALPVIQKSPESLAELELIPFQEAIRAGIPAITIAHILFPKLEPENLPATLSRRIVTGLLREKLGFQGLIISDCMEMNAILNTVGVAKGAVEAVKAGIELIFISRSLAEVAETSRALEAAVLSGEISLHQIDQAVEKILTYKQRYCKPCPPLSKEELAEACRFAKSFTQDAIAQSQTGSAGPFQLGGNPLFLSPPARQSTQAANAAAGGCSFAEMMQRHFGGACRLLPQNPTPEEISTLAALAKQHSSTVLAITNGLLHPGQLALTKALAKAPPPLALVALQAPLRQQDIPSGCYSLALYDDTPETVRLADIFFTADTEGA